jgi:hypothetical protein
MAIAIVNDVELNAILPLQEILRRARSGEIPKKFLVPLLIGRYAEDAADASQDGSFARVLWLSIAEGIEDWFQAESCALKRAQ